MSQHAPLYPDTQLARVPQQLHHGTLGVIAQEGIGAKRFTLP